MRAIAALLLVGCTMPPPSTPDPRATAECWDLVRGDDRGRLCITRDVEDRGGRVRMTGAEDLDVAYARVEREGAAGTQYESLFDDRGERIVVIERCAMCGCGGCVREVRVRDDAWTNPACPSVTLEGCPQGSP